MSSKSKALTSKQRDKVADKLMTWANMVFAGMVIAQLFTGQFDLFIGILGIVLFGLAYFVSINYMKGGIK